jgi:hypothetical protein
MRTTWVLLAALLSFGFIVETPESRKEREQQHQLWRKQFQRAYDLKALHTFLAEQIAATPQIEGVDLSKSRLAARWSLSEGVARCGDWVFVGKVGGGDFVLQWTYSDIPHSDGSGGIWKIVHFHCRRHARDQFRRLSAGKTEDEYVVLLP